jgi:hypothetical protein
MQNPNSLDIVAFHAFLTHYHKIWQRIYCRMLWRDCHYLISAITVAATYGGNKCHYLMQEIYL